MTTDIHAMREKICELGRLLYDSKLTDAAGCGDGILAAIAYALANHLPLEEGLRLGTAAVGAVILTPAAADCRKEDIERLLQTVELIPYP